MNDIGRSTILKQIKIYLLVCAVTCIPAISNAQANYEPAKVVYDVAISDPTELSHILDRVGLLQKIYRNDSFEASIILVVHEGAIPLFVKTNKSQHAFMQRVKSLTLGEIIQFRICEASANLQGLNKDDFDSYLQLVPMADAEIIKLQNTGYAYMK